MTENIEKKDDEIVYEKKWYIIHTYSGYEKKVATDLEKRIQSLNLTDRVFRVLVPEEEVLEAMEASYGYQPVSLDMPSNDDSEDKDMTLGDRVGTEEKNFKYIEEMDFINRFMETLNELEVQIIRGRFFDNKTQSVIAEELGISQMTVSRLEKKIIEKLKKEYNKVV